MQENEETKALRNHCKLKSALFFGNFLLGLFLTLNNDLASQTTQWPRHNIRSSQFVFIEFSSNTETNVFSCGQIEGQESIMPAYTASKLPFQKLWSVFVEVVNSVAETIWFLPIRFWQRNQIIWVYVHLILSGKKQSEKQKDKSNGSKQVSVG